MTLHVKILSLYTINHQSSHRYPVPELQLVTARTRQLEEARGVGERRTEVARSELARLSTTRLEPSVALRRKEFETRASRREARSLDVQPQQGILHLYVYSVALLYLYRVALYSVV